jgi:hypothetical protein
MPASTFARKSPRSHDPAGDTAARCSVRRSDGGSGALGRLRPLLRGRGRGRADPADPPVRGDGLDLGRLDRAARPDRARDHLRPPRVRAVRRHTRALHLHAHRRRRSASGALADGTGGRSRASAGAAIAVDLAVRRPDLVRAAIAHEFPWRFTRHLPSGSQIAALAKIGSLILHGRQSDAAEELLRSAYTYRDGRSAWEAFPAAWHQVARENASAALMDFRNSIVAYPSASDLATITVPVVCSYGSRSPDSMVRLVRSLAAAIPTATTREIEGAGHAAPFDAPTQFVQLIADSLSGGRP